MYTKLITATLTPFATAVI